MADRFPSPFEIEAPDGAEGWQDLYSYSAVFSEERRDFQKRRVAATASLVHTADCPSVIFGSVQCRLSSRRERKIAIEKSFPEYASR